MRWPRVEGTFITRRDRTDEPLHVLVERLHEATEDALENHLHDRLGGRRHAEHVVVPREARRDDRTPAPRRCGSREEHRVRNVLPEQLVAVVKALEVEELSEEFDGRLGAVRLDEPVWIDTVAILLSRDA